jgi:phosphonate transport system permease protein
MSAAVATEPPSNAFKARYPEVFGRSFLARWRPLIVILGVVAYCAYAIWFFAIPSVIVNAHWERTSIYLAQWISHDIRLELRTGGGKVETRWERYSQLGKDPHPSWVVPNADGSVAVEVVGAGNGIVVTPSTVIIAKAGEQVTFAMGGDVPRAEGPVPPWVQIKEDEVRANWGFWGTVSFDADRIKVARRFLGWANFIFDTTSPFFGKSAGEVLSLVFFGPRIGPDKSNLALAFDNVWNNADWQHGDVWTKLFQTVVMAFAGTLLAALVAFPLSFLAARNITRSKAANQAFKRFFDFQRSVDMLIWALFFTRAFGPGPLAGIGAIFFTETGTFGKLYSEALENIDDKQPEGIKSVGASPLLVRRFGILPQVFPVFASQTLYFWESNTRSATIIGAVGAGGIGLKLWEAMQTNTNWANVLYMVILILMVVYAFDNFSNRLRRRLIGDLPI